MNVELADAITASNRTYASVARDTGIEEELLHRAAIGLRRYFSIKQIERLAALLGKNPNDLGLMSRHVENRARAVKPARKAARPKAAPVAAPVAPEAAAAVKLQIQ